MEEQNEKFVPMNSKQLQQIRGGEDSGTTSCTAVCDSTIVTTCCYNVVKPPQETQ